MCAIPLRCMVIRMSYLSLIRLQLAVRERASSMPAALSFGQRAMQRMRFGSKATDNNRFDDATGYVLVPGGSGIDKAGAAFLLGITENDIEHEKHKEIIKW